MLFLFIPVAITIIVLLFVALSKAFAGKSNIEYSKSTKDQLAELLSEEAADWDEAINASGSDFPEAPRKAEKFPLTPEYAPAPAETENEFKRGEYYVPLTNYSPEGFSTQGYSKAHQAVHESGLREASSPEGIKSAEERSARPKQKLPELFRGKDEYLKAIIYSEVFSRRSGSPDRHCRARCE